MLRQWVAAMTEQGLAPATVCKAAQLVSSALAAAVDERLIAANPAERLPLPKVETKEMRFLTPNEIATLADTIDARYRTWVLTAAYSGLRSGELAGLRRHSIDLMRHRIEVSKGATEVSGKIDYGPTKTRASFRRVPIPRPVAALLTEHVAGLEPDDLVFTAPAGGYLRTNTHRRRFFYPATVKAGLGEYVKVAQTKQLPGATNPRPATHSGEPLDRCGASPKEIAVWAGHSSVATVLDRYGHLLPGQEDRVTDALGDDVRRGYTGPVGAGSASASRLNSLETVGLAWGCDWP